MPEPSAIRRVRERIKSAYRDTGLRPSRLTVSPEEWRALLLEADSICTVAQGPAGLSLMQIDGVEITTAIGRS